MNLSRTLRNTNHISELQNRVFILHVIKDAHIPIDIFFLISLIHLIHAINRHYNLMKSKHSFRVNDLKKKKTFRDKKDFVWTSNVFQILYTFNVF
jgi:hypothetical protein